MSTDAIDRLRTENPDVNEVKNAVGRVVFGDRGGLFVFLLVLAGSMLAWRTTVTINDNYTVVNGLVALADGHLHVTQAAYGPSLDTPGMVQVDGRAYPRNVAHIVFALPFLWFVRGVTTVVDPRIAIGAGWSLLLLGTAIVGGQLTGYERESRVGGSLLALVAFAASIAFATPLPRTQLALVALQFATMVAAALLAVLVYRLIVQIHDYRVGLTAGLATGLASPFLFWASVPKRHVLTALLAVTSIYLFYRSRKAEEPSATSFRLLAYVPGGLTAWLNAAEGLVLLFAVGIVDLLTARQTTLRKLAGIAAVTVLSLVPFFVTNALISGSPFAPPRTLPDYGSGSTPNLFGDSAGGGGGSSGFGDSTGGGGGSLGSGVSIVQILPSPVRKGFTLFWYMWLGLNSVLFDLNHTYRVFVRSGYIEFWSSGATGLAVNLAFLESLPLAGPLVAAPITAYRRFHTNVASPTTATDLLVLVYSVFITLLYVHRLPVHASLTVRYLIPVFPLAIYGVARLPWVRESIRTNGNILGWTYVAGVLVGGQLLAAAVVLIEATPDEAIQGCALLLLASATALGLWSLASALGYRANRAGAVLLATAGALTTNTMLLVVYDFFGKAFALPIVPF